MNSPKLYFLPWLRRGLATELATVDDGAPTISRSPDLSVWVEVDGTEVRSEVQLRPADHVTAIEAGQISRRYPAPGSRNVETGYWPLIDFVAPDLPWAMTPLAPNDGDHGSLRPWLVLVCAPAADIVFDGESTEAPATITVNADLLPDLADAKLWAHIQSSVPDDQTASSVGSPGVVFARLVAPVVLEPETTYRVSLVPTFRMASDTELTLSWTAESDKAVTLTAYDSWTFTTGVASTFEEVVQLLAPVPPGLDLNLGITPVDVTDLGAIDPWPDADEVVVDYTGALTDTDVKAAGLGNLKAAFDHDVTLMLNQGDFRVILDDDEDDPVVTPPLYGSYAKSTHTVPEDKGWLRSLNLAPRNRMAAGLGADVVRTHQERYMAQAWRQAGEVMEMRRALNAQRLQAEISRTWKSRADALDPAQHSAVFRPQYSTVRSDADQPARAALRFSAIPDGLFDPAFVRMTRPRAVVDRTASARQAAPNRERPNPPSWKGIVTEQFGDPDRRAEIGFGAVKIPAGAYVRGRESETQQPPIERRPFGTDTASSRFTADRPDDLALAALHKVALERIKPMQSGRGRVDQRIAGLADHLAAIEWPGDEIPVRVKIGPTIDEALVWALIDESAELLMPGASEFPDNAVRLVTANPAFVSAFLAGANHEMSRELLWREYPADMGSTTFRRFWDRPPGQRDIRRIHGWDDEDSLADIGASGGESVVVLARGDVFRLYPSMQILLRDPAGTLQPPLFGGTIPPATRFFAFDVESQDEVLSGGWQVVFQEPLTEPRFGLDDDVPVLDDRNSAHYASSAYQKPFSYPFDVDQIIGEGDQ